MAVREKADPILTENPDILVIPECESRKELIFKKDTPKPTDTYWHGDILECGNENRIVFNVGDNKYRLICGYYFGQS